MDRAPGTWARSLGTRRTRGHGEVTEDNVATSEPGRGTRDPRDKTILVKGAERINMKLTVNDVETTSC